MQNTDQIHNGNISFCPLAALQNDCNWIFFNNGSLFWQGILKQFYIVKVMYEGVGMLYTYYDNFTSFGSCKACWYSR